MELRLPWISRIARPDGVCKMFGSGLGALLLLPLAGMEMEMAGIIARPIVSANTKQSRRVAQCRNRYKITGLRLVFAVCEVECFESCGA